MTAVTTAKIALTIACIAATVLLLFFERALSRVSQDSSASRFDPARLRSGRKIAKSIASLCFVGVGFAAATLPNAWLGIGLLLGASGDVALLGESRRSLLVGIVLFLGGHIAYIGAFVPLGEATPSAAIGGAVSAAIGVGVLRVLWSRVGRLRPAVIAYIAVIVIMLTAALATGLPYLIAGAVLFFVSDLAVARQRFLAKSFLNKAWGLPTYYAGQLIIAWSACALAEAVP